MLKAFGEVQPGRRLTAQCQALVGPAALLALLAGLPRSVQQGLVQAPVFFLHSFALVFPSRIFRILPLELSFQNSNVKKRIEIFTLKIGSLC